MKSVTTFLLCGAFRQSWRGKTSYLQFTV